MGGIALVCALVLAPAGMAEAKQCTKKGTRHDDVLKGTKRADVLCGKGGDDVLIGKRGNDVLKGSKGDDTLLGKGGEDALKGGGGDDQLIGGADADELGGQGGVDTASFADSAAPVIADLQAGTASGDANEVLSAVENVIGSSQSDTLSGDAAANDLRGGEGADTLAGGGGDDRLDGQAGDDTASFADASAAVSVDLRAGTSSGDGTDALSGIEDVLGSTHDDVIASGGGDERLDGAGGFDTISYAGAAGPVSVDLGAGTATGDGNDALVAIEAATGSPFGDVLRAGSGRSRLVGGDGADLLAGGAGDDELDGQGGDDTVTYAAAPGPVSASLATGVATGQGNDTLASVENLTGSAHADTLEGDAGANAIVGGEGGDTVSFAHADSGVAVDLGAGTATAGGIDSLMGIENIAGSAQGDDLTGDSAANRIDGGGGADSVAGGDGDDRLSGEAGDDQLFGDPGDDDLYGGDGDDSLDGGTGTNVCDGGAGTNVLAASCDPSAPVLTAVTVAPTSFDTNAAPRTLEFTLSATDTVSGIDAAASTITIFGPDGEQRDETALSTTGGDALDGTFAAAVEIPQYAPQGTWTIGVELRDEAGNLAGWTSSQLIAAGYPGSFDQTGAGDTAAPLLSDFDIAPPSVDTSGAAQTLNFTIAATDDLAGVDAGASVVRVFAPDGSLRGESSVALTSGDPSDGIYAATFDLPRYSPEGAWTVQLLLVDGAGNQILWGSSMLSAAGHPAGFDQTGPGDDTGPELTGFAIEPTQINTSSGSEEVTFDLTVTDDFAGVSLTASRVVVIEPGGDVAGEVPLQRLSGTALNGTYQAVYTVAEGAPGGRWTVEVHLVDEAGNETVLDESELDPSGFENEIGLPS